MQRRTILHFIPKSALCARAFLPLVALFLLLAPVTRLYAQATDLHDAAMQLTKKLHDDPDVQKISGEHIVIAPFENINGKGDAVPRILQEMFTTSFIKAKHFKVLERDQLQSALEELHFQLSDLADPAKAKKVGKLVGAAYVLLGSISDTGSTTTINARIVSIESGESVSADDIDIKTGDAASGISGLNPSANPATTTTPDTPQPPVAVKPETPAIDLNANATSVSAGQYIGQKSNFGLLGGTKFQIAWREILGKDPVYSFSAGDVLGDNTRRLVLRTVNANRDACVRVLKWDGRNFSQTWESQGVSNLDPISPSDPSYLRTSADFHKPALISLSSDVSCVNAWRWDGTTFAPQDIQRFTPSIIEWLPGKPSSYLGIGVADSHQNGMTVTYVAKVIDVADKADKEVSTNNNSYSGFAVTTADLDGDGELEIAIVAPSDIKTDGKPIEIYSLAGLRKAATVEGYGSRLTTWNPTAFKYPFLVARKNTHDADGNLNGGFVYFIQWNGESYEQVWKSNQMDDQVIDMQVCDPKGEGKPGLVILSADKSGYYLTKIVHVN